MPGWLNHIQYTICVPEITNVLQPPLDRPYRAEIFVGESENLSSLEALENAWNPASIITVHLGYK